MLPKKLNRKWLCFAIFRIACSAHSENGPQVTFYTENSMTNTKREVIIESNPKML
jgi:hypothetical protein